MTAAANALVDVDRLAGWMDARGLGTGLITDIMHLSGGTQNALIRFSRSGRDYVLRRPPSAPRPNSNETMRREARLLAAIAKSDVPHPRLVASCGETDPLGVAFYLMEPVEGFNPVVGLPAPHNENADWRRRMGFALIEGIAALHRLDYRKVGLEGFGNPDGYLDRQVERWRRQLEAYALHENWPGPAGIPGVAAVASWLAANLPPPSAPGILHGDYQFANVMFRHDAPALAAIVDWELASIGDPLVDLGWIIATWRESGLPELPVLKIEPWEGFPRAEDLIEHYGQLTARDLTHIEWYVVLACYRLGIILEGTYARACEGKAPMETGRLLHETAVALFERALMRIGCSGGSPRTAAGTH
ncbi:aminoglycoside phosphotransferase (APT) family kinase protein [Bradyrhizobium sp. CIR48]|uniref:phosphotransferase family protein n=1 Tax=Bradyrhizobium sp. CIR48 TaxID=2663840 RepID=UPI00160579CB|nr:phosphotransferase family protein [Bradyrhizobium sp. CIR48]MBB4425430.1 aminoglycoside phosphotransferase (APT) family kinase protein [Bradyrhizobium sp. CIR48]